MNHDYRSYGDAITNELRVAKFLVEERRRVLDAQAPNMGRRQAAFARASECLADRTFTSQGERVQAEVFLAGFFAGDA